MLQNQINNPKKLQDVVLDGARLSIKAISQQGKVVTPEVEVVVDQETHLVILSRKINPIMVQGEKDFCYQSQGDRKARSHDHQECSTKLPPQASFPFAPLASPGGHQKGAVQDSYSAIAYAIAQARHKRSAAIEARFQSYYEGGFYARQRLNCHIYKSLPSHLQASTSNLDRSWFAIHYKVAEFALNQADRAARRRGLKHVGDTRDFIARHCGWYLSFCTLSSFLFGKAEDVKNAPLG